MYEQILSGKTKWQIVFTLFLAIILLLTSCSGPTQEVSETEGTEPEVAETEGQGEEVADTEEPVQELGELVPPLLMLGWSIEQDPARHEIGMMIARDMEEFLGVEVEHRPVEGSWSPYFTAETDYEADFCVTGHAGRPWRIDPDTLLSRYHSDNIYDGGTNRYAYSNPEYDELVEKQRAEFDVDKRRELVWQAQEVMHEDAVVVNIYAQEMVGVYNKDLFTGIVPMFGQGLFNFWNTLELEPKTDQTILRVATIVEPQSMNVVASRLGELEILQQVFDTLTRIKPDGSTVNWAAANITNPDLTTFRIELRPDMTWHDGMPVTAEDVKFTFDYYKEKGQPRLEGLLEQLVSVEIVDDLTVDFNLESPSTAFTTTVLGQSFLIPKHIWENIESPHELSVTENPDIMIGSGPFVFEHWRRGEDIELKAFTDYFQPPKVDGLRHILYSTHDAALLDFLAGKVDISQWQVLPEHAAEAEQAAHLEVVRTPDIAARHIAFNVRRPPMSDKSFRQAVAYIIRYDHVSEVIYGGYSQPWTPPLITIGNPFWANTELEHYTFDPDRAKQILMEAGYGWDDEGRLHFPPN